ncbi:MAG: hypothetical protein ACKVOH_07105, partial [Chlamydiales bacterium]
RGAFWMGSFLSSHMLLQLLLNRSYSLRRQRHPSLLWRLLFGWTCCSHRLYRALHAMPQERIESLFLIHDFYTPPEAIEKFLEGNTIYPVWLCPVKGTETPQHLSPHFGRPYFVNIGLYGKAHNPSLGATLERKITELGGKKMLYSFCYFERELFAKIYAEKWYNSLRKKFSAENRFPHLYNKIKCYPKSTYQTTTTSVTT